MKLPASLADLGLAALVAFALRDRPRWAVVAAGAVLLVPATWYVSAWWGQYESIFMLSGLGAAIATANGRNGFAAVLIAVSLSTKPQAIPFVLPFAAWFWASGYAAGGLRGGVRELARTGIVGLAALVVLWLPFIPAGRPLDYLANLSTYQGEIFNVLSLRAWNAWWLLQETAAGGNFIADDIAIAGPITLRHLGFAITGLLSLVVAAAIIRDPAAARLVRRAGRVCADVLHVPDPDARALRLRGALVPRPPAARTDRTAVVGVALARVRGRLLAEPGGRDPALVGDRGDAADRGRAGCRRIGWPDRHHGRRRALYDAIADRMTPRRGRAVFAVASTVAFLTILGLGLGMTFFSDEWAFIERWRIHEGLRTRPRRLPRGDPTCASSVAGWPGTGSPCGSG